MEAKESCGSDFFSAWLGEMQSRHLRSFSFAEVRRAVQALSAAYVEHRSRIAGGAVNTAGKRAAYALFYAPLHFMQVRHVVLALSAECGAGRTLLDLGCGTGAGGAAWGDALRCRNRAGPPFESSELRIMGVDQDSWALQEALWTYSFFGFGGISRLYDFRRRPLQVPSDQTVLAAFVVNELEPATRGSWLTRFVEAGRSGARVLVIEPVARRVAPWWDQWADAFREAGGRADAWKFSVELPPWIKKMDRASGLDHRTLTCRSLWLDGRGAGGVDQFEAKPSTSTSTPTITPTTTSRSRSL